MTVYERQNTCLADTDQCYPRRLIENTTRSMLKMLSLVNCNVISIEQSDKAVEYNSEQNRTSVEYGRNVHSFYRMCVHVIFMSLRVFVSSTTIGCDISSFSLSS